MSARGSCSREPRAQSFTTAESVRRCEHAALTALPARDRWELPGWLCSSDDGGFVARANSATPVPHPEPVSLPEVVASYAARGLPPLIRWTPQASDAAATDLAGAAWRTWGEVLVMTRDLAATAPSTDGDPPTVAADVASPAWRDAYVAQYAAVERSARSRLAEQAPAPKRYVRTERRGTTASVGLGTVVGGALGVFDVVTAPEHRRGGEAERIVTWLLTWGAREGADVAYLQVAADNAAAVALYRKLGFATAYTYVYAAPTEPRR